MIWMLLLVHTGRTILPKTLLWPVRWAMGKDGSSVTFLTTDKTTCLRAAADDQIEYMRQGFSTFMEGHFYGDPRIQKPLLWLAKFAPDRMEFQQMCRRAGLRRFFEGFEPPAPVKEPEPDNPHGAPAWAVWQRAAMQKLIDWFHWRIENQQLYTGEFGATWNDDTCNFEGLPCLLVEPPLPDGASAASAARQFSLRLEWLSTRMSRSSSWSWLTVALLTVVEPSWSRSISICPVIGSVAACCVALYYNVW